MVSALDVAISKNRSNLRSWGNIEAFLAMATLGLERRKESHHRPNEGVVFQVHSQDLGRYGRRAGGQQHQRISIALQGS